MLKKELSANEMAKIAADAIERFLNAKINAWRARHLDPILERGLDVMSSLLTAGEQNFTGYCGLIPEVGGIVCSRFAIALHMTWDWIVRPSLMNSARDIFKTQTAAMISKARAVIEKHMRAVLKNRSPKKADRKYGDLGKSLHKFAKRFSSKVSTELKSENDYRRSMRSLVGRLQASQQ